MHKVTIRARTCGTIHMLLLGPPQALFQVTEDSIGLYKDRVKGGRTLLCFWVSTKLELLCCHFELFIEDVGISSAFRCCLWSCCWRGTDIESPWLVLMEAKALFDRDSCVK